MQKDKMPIQDEQARDTAIFETSKNILVEAGAGTGKTTTMTLSSLAK